MIPNTKDVKSQKSHVDADVNVKKNEMTNGHKMTINGKNGRYLQKAFVMNDDVVCSEGRDGS